MDIPDSSALEALLQNEIKDERRYRRFVRLLEGQRAERDLMYWQVKVLEALEAAHGLLLPRAPSALRDLLPALPLPQSLEADEVPSWIKIDTLGGACPVEGTGTMGDWHWYFRAKYDGWTLEAECGAHADTVSVGGNSDTTFYVEEEYGDFSSEASYMPLGEVRYVLVRELTRLRDRARDESADGFLTTYGQWDIHSFVRTFPDEIVNIVIVQVRSEVSGEAASITGGDLVRRIWAATRERFRGAHGHRLAWLDLAFFVAGADLEGTARAMAPLTVDAPSGFHISFAVAASPADAPQRLVAVDQLAMDLSKVEYRGQYPSAWCGRNGRIVHRP